MGRKRKIPYTLDPGEVNPLSYDDLAAILRGADDLIGEGGRSLLSKILKGSKDKAVLSKDLDDSPVYGYFGDLTLKQVLQRVDRAIIDGYLRIEYIGELPLLSFTTRGWDIARAIRVDELFHEFDIKIVSEDPPFDMEYLKDRNRQMIMDLLDKVETSGDKRYIPLLQDWSRIDYKKIKLRISTVIKRLKENK